MLAMFCFCTFKLSNSFLPNCQFLFCQATQFCSAKLNIFARGGPRPPRPPPKNAYDQGHYAKQVHSQAFLGGGRGGQGKNIQLGRTENRAEKCSNITWPAISYSSTFCDISAIFCLVSAIFGELFAYFSFILACFLIHYSVIFAQ